MTDVEHALDSTDQCARTEIDEGSGTGANAGSTADMVLITAPLSELVWSQHNGLALQNVASSLPNKKAPFLWNTESFDIIISPSQYANGGDSSNSRDSIERDPNLLQLKLNTVEKHSTSRGNTVCRNPLSLIKISEQKDGSFGDKELVKTAHEFVLDNKEEKDNQSDKKVGICSHEINNNCDVCTCEIHTVGAELDDTEASISLLGSNNSSYIFRPRTEAVHKINDSSAPGNCGQSVGSLFCKLNELRPDLPQVEVDSASNIQTSPDRFEGMGQTENNWSSGLAIISAHDDQWLVKYASPVNSAACSRSADCGDANLATDTAEDHTSSRIPLQVTSLNPSSRQCSGDAPPLDFEQTSGFGMPAVLYCASESKGRTLQASHSHKSPPNVFRSCCNMNNLMGKGKEHVASDTEENESISKESGDSHGSIESSNSKRPFLTGKRARSDSKMLAECKRYKKETNGSSSSHSLRKDSSFINWISTIANGFSRPSKAASFAIFPQPSENDKRKLDCPTMAHEEAKVVGTSCRNMGFKSIFQALYHSGLGVENCTSRSHDHQRQIDASTEPKVASKPSDHCAYYILGERMGNSHRTGPASSKRADTGSKDSVSGAEFNVDSPDVVRDSDGVKLHNEVSMLGERLNQVEEFSSLNNNMFATDSEFHERRKHGIRKAGKLSKLGSTSSYIEIDSQSASKGKGNDLIPNDCTMMTNKSSGFLDNLWITRLSPKASAVIPKSVEHVHAMDENLASSCNLLNPVSEKNDATSYAKQRNSEYNFLPSKKSCRDAVAYKGKEHMICPTDLVRLRKESNQKLKSNLNPISPSQRFKNLEPMASTFAKRLDALRHIKPSKLSKATTSATITCFFCGRNGHSIIECSELVENELKDLLENMNSLNGRDKSPYLCIRCFQLSHWAIACPYAALRGDDAPRNSHIVNNENCSREENKLVNDSSTSHDRRIILWSGDKQEHPLYNGQKNSLRGQGGPGTEFVIHSNGSSGMVEVGGPSVRDLYLNMVKEDMGRSAVEAKPTSNFGEDGPLRSQTVPFCNDLNAEVTDESVGLFKIIRKLRLSRTDIIRLMKSANSHFSLHGYFLRLRLGKWGKVSGGTGYHVAHINDASCKNGLWVSVGGSTSLIDYHFISNHDFVEDELKAWWSATLKDGQKPSLREELNRKLEEREKFGF